TPLHPHRQLLAFCLGLALASSVSAHEPERLEETVVVGKRSDLLGVAQAATEGSASGDELRARPLLRRGEVLETVPGMIVTQHAGGGKANQYFLRGFNLDHGTDFAISLDGMPVNMRTHAHGQGYADLNLVIPELIERVDYFKGTYAARNGDLSSAGSADFRYVDRLSRGFANFETGAYNYYRGVFGHTFDIGKSGGDNPRPTGSLTIAGEFTSYDGPWVLPEDFARWNGLVRYFSGTEDDHLSITMMAYSGRWTSTDQIPGRAVGDGRLDRFGFVDPTNGGDSQRYSLQFHWQQSDGNSTTALNLYGIYYDLDLFSNFTYALDDPALGDQFEQTESRFVVGGELTRKWHDVQFLNRPTTFTLGLQTRTDFIDGIGLFRTTQRQRTATVRQDDVTQVSAGIFGEAATKWTPWLRTNIGLRGDLFSFDTTSDNAANSGSDVDGIVSPKFTAIFGPWKETELYLSFGTGFHSNDARGVNTTVDPSSGDPVPRVDPLVRTIGAEIGMRTQIIPKVTATASLWWLDSDSELIYVGDAGTNEPGPASRRFGVETAVYWSPADWLTFDAEFAATHARLRDNGDNNRIPYSVPWMLSGGFVLGAQGRQPGWFTGMRVRAFGQRPLTEDNTVKGRPTVTVNANLGYRAEKWEVALECLNLLDRRDNDIEYFYTSRLAGEPAGGIDDIHFHPAEPRMLRARFAYRW
ncbi:MAG: TonB-dependent receptor, partial [Chthoniobacteraceae bacterium]